MEQNSNNDRRKYQRYYIGEGLIFSDRQNIIGLAQVVDLSRSGIKCVSISEPTCPLGKIRDIDLAGVGETAHLTGLSGRMIRCSALKNRSDTSLGLNSFEFSLEFHPRFHPLIKRFKQKLLQERTR
ncbi:MAG: hypothetical protein D6B25_03475 [Desulfobulbaceae bacterium]|nr:MAG: hypothetical protein D6B25_03475 [Desulfobulbaceae bacterium]